MIVVGIDPGSSGALYELRFTRKKGWVPGDYLRLPFAATGDRSAMVDAAALASWLDGRPEEPRLVALEDVGYLPPRARRESAGGEGAPDSGFSSVRLARGVGQIEGVLDLMRARGGSPWALVRSMDWQRVCGVKIDKIAKEKSAARKARLKAATVAFCRTRYPTAVLVPPRCRVVQEGLADALGIAHWAAARVEAIVP